MNQEFLKNKIDALSKDEIFMSKVNVCETAEEICTLYAEEGIEITPEELDAAIKAIASKDGEEFSEDDLDSVAGGFISATAFLTYSIVYSLVICQAAYVLGKAGNKKKK